MTTMIMLDDPPTIEGQMKDKKGKEGVKWVFNSCEEVMEIHNKQ